MMKRIFLSMSTDPHSCYNFGRLRGTGKKHAGITGHHAVVEYLEKQ
jgi:hypothetical protein